MSFEVLGEPGFWVLVSLLAVGAERALGAALSRPYYRELNALHDALLSNPEVVASPEVRAVARERLASSLWKATVWYGPLVFAYAAPIAVTSIIYRSVTGGGTAPMAHKISSSERLAFMAVLHRSPIVWVWVKMWTGLSFILAPPERDGDKSASPLFAVLNRLHWR